jgi:hypothetical protein
MITDERLQNIIAYLSSINATKNTSLAKVDQEKLEMAKELLALRQRVAELEQEIASLKGIDDGTEVCSECGCMVESVWHTSDELWLKYAGFGNLGGVLCMRCFDRKYEIVKQEERKDGKSHGILYWDAHEGEFITYAYKKLEQERDEWRDDAESLDGFLSDQELYDIDSGRFLQVSRKHKSLVEKHPKVVK